MGKSCSGQPIIKPPSFNSFHVWECTNCGRDTRLLRTSEYLHRSRRHVLPITVRLATVFLRWEEAGRANGWFNIKLLNPGTEVDTLRHPTGHVYILAPGTFSPSLLRYNWHIMRKCRCTTWWFDRLYCKRRTTVRSVDTPITSHRYHLCVWGGEFLRSTLSATQVYNTALLTVVAVPCIRSPELSRLISGSLYALTTSTHFPTSPPLTSTNLLCFYEFGFY